MVGSAGSKVSHTQNWEKRGFWGIIMDARAATLSSGLLCAATNQATIQKWSFFIH